MPRGKWERIIRIRAARELGEEYRLYAAGGQERSIQAVSPVQLGGYNGEIKRVGGE